MSLVPIIEQVRQLPWATLDDLTDALEDAYAYGTVCARLVNVDGDLRFLRAKPESTVNGRSGGRRRRDVPA